MVLPRFLRLQIMLSACSFKHPLHKHVTKLKANRFGREPSHSGKDFVGHSRHNAGTTEQNYC